MLKVTISFLTLKLNLLSWTSITARAVTRKGHPKMIGTDSPSSISNITKSTGKMKLSDETWQGLVYWVHAKEIEAWDPFICNDSYESESSDDDEDVENDGSQSRDKVTADNDVERVSESSCMHNNDLLYDNNHNNIMSDKDKVLSEDLFNLYDILNKRKDSGDNLKYLPGFTPSVINVEEVNEKVKGATGNEETKMKSMELVTIKTLWGNSSFDYALSSSLGNSEGILCIWEPTLFVKDNVTSSDNFLAIMGGSNEKILSDRSLLLKELNDINSIDSLEAAQKSKLAIRGTLVDGEWIVDSLAVKSVLSLEQQAYLERNLFIFALGTFPPGCNSSLIALIPKIDDAKVIKDYRPISLFLGIPIDSSLTLSHIFFVDDAIFIGKWDSLNIRTIVNFLKCFHLASGLKINFHKSKLMGINTRLEEVDATATAMGCLIFTTPFVHLRVKVGGAMSRIKSCDDVVAKVSSRLSKWKLKTLSIGGRLTLIKSVLTSITLCHMSIFKVLSRVLRLLESIR
ncbi:hypothetical protein Tco_0545471 [Tanacetum coccineum]